MIKILIVDDSSTIRFTLNMMFEMDKKSFEVIGLVSNGLESVEFCEENEPDIILMDVNMPIMNGIEATKRIVSKQPDAIVIGFSINDNIETNRQMIDAGAKSFLQKNSSPSQVFETIFELAGSSS